MITSRLGEDRELDADLIAIYQIELVGQSKKLNDNDNATDAGADQKMFALSILEKNQRGG